MSIFQHSCTYCEGDLMPVQGALWRCVECDTVFELCGRVLVVHGLVSDTDVVDLTGPPELEQTQAPGQISQL